MTFYKVLPDQWRTLGLTTPMVVYNLHQITAPVGFNASVQYSISVSAFATFVRIP